MSFSNPFVPPQRQGQPAMQIWNWPYAKEQWNKRARFRNENQVAIDNTRRVLDKFTAYCPHLIDRMVDQITNMELLTYQQRRQRDTWRGRGICNRTINNETDVLCALFAWLGPKTTSGPGRENLGMIPNPPWVRHLPEDRNNPRSLTPPTLAHYFAATSIATTPTWNGMSPRKFWVVAAVVAGVTGLRRRALLEVPRPDDYTLRTLRQIVVPAKFVKTRQELRLSLGTEEVAEMAYELPSKVGEPLLPWRGEDGKRLSYNHFTRAMRAFQLQYGIEAGIGPDEVVRIKDFRSTAATEVADMFGDGVARQLLGHSPNTNTLNTNYKSARVGPQNVAAGAYLAEKILLPHAQEALEPPRPRVYEPEAS